MKKLLFIRHAESFGNKMKIIQGHADFNLTETGKKELSSLINSNFSRFNNYDSIISSPLKRTYETAEIISGFINASVENDELLKEFSAGILDGLSKEEAKEKYEKYYKIWEKRGDLDQIPKAESGDMLQVRTLMFLERFLGEDYNHIIVSHAGFLRCLINTINGNKRTTPLNLDHDQLYELEDIFDKINFEKNKLAKNSIVYKISTCDRDYIIKKEPRWLEKKDYDEKELIDYLSNYVNIPKIYLMTNRKKYFLKGIEYKDGVHIIGNLNDIQIKNTTEMLKKMQNLLYNIKDKYSYEQIDMIKELQLKINDIEDEKTKKIALSILKNENFINGISRDSISIVHDDLHRSNILYDGNTPIFLDFDGLKKYPITYQLASHIASSYILNDSNFNIDNVLKYWNQGVDREYLNSLIRYRLIMGLIYFQKRIENSEYNIEDSELRDKYFKTFQKIRRI